MAYVTAEYACASGDPVFFGGVTGIVVKQKTPSAGAGLTNPNAAAIAEGEDVYVIDAGNVVVTNPGGDFEKGDPVYIDNEGNLVSDSEFEPFGRVFDVGPDRGLPPTKMRVSLDAKDDLTVGPDLTPTAAVTADPNPVTRATTVTIDASDTTLVDEDGSIAKYEFDLNGNGTYELDNGTDDTTTTSYTPTNAATITIVEVVKGAALTNEQQSVTIAHAVGGTFTLTYSGQTTAPIAYNASAATVKAALVALSNIGPSDVDVTGSAGGPWTVEFKGDLAATDVDAMTSDGDDLIEEYVTVGVRVTDDDDRVSTASVVVGVKAG